VPEEIRKKAYNNDLPLAVITLLLSPSPLRGKAGVGGKIIDQTLNPNPPPN